MVTIMTQQKRNLFTLILLCLGYFIDFYDLTIMGVSYSELIKQQFQITSIPQIQQTYLLISNFQTAGIFIGAILFGVLGDKIGRASAIKYSILLYSLATIAATFTHSLPLFIFLRMLAYVGLATEFSTSTVLILELFPVKSAAWGTALLYSFGVLGGICATLIGFVSWQAMFLAGGIAGLLLFFGRSHLKESTSFIEAKLQYKNKTGSVFELFTNPKYLRLIFIYLIMIIPYFAMIGMMFIFPNYIIKHLDLGHATKLLLMGFFVGNILSSLLSVFFIERKRSFIFLSLGLFLILMTVYRWIPESDILVYSIGLGLIGGGYPILWAQMSASSFPIHIRSLASNILFALGRASGIIFNIMISAWIIDKQLFVQNGLFLVVALFILSSISVWRIKKPDNQTITF